MHEYLVFARRGRNAAWRYVCTLVLGLGLCMAISIAVLVPLEQSGLAPGLSRQLANPSEPVAFFLATGLMFASLGLGVALSARWIQAKRVGDLIGVWRWPLFARGFLAWSGVMVLIVLMDTVLAPGSLRTSATRETPALVAAALVALIPQVMAEELVFRGLITQGLLLALRRSWPTALVSGLIFGAMHIPNGVPHAVSATGVGVLGAFIAIRTGGLALVSGLHLANNLFGAVVVVSAHDAFRGAPALFSQDAPQLLWVDVGLTFLGMGVLAALAARAPSWNGRRIAANAPVG